ncbi:MAG TPA: APC family permease [Steroidobacteraceae bacterium]|nr:APC family permease [Steroidobacteraceae bacterium]
MSTQTMPQSLSTPEIAVPVMESAPPGDQLSAGVLGTADIVFMVVAAAAPMAVVVALMPMAFGFGNGAGVAGAWLGALIAMLLFAVGYVRIIPFVRNAGAFYAYIAASIGRIWGLGAAYVAAFSYFTLACSTLGALAFFGEQLFETLTGRALHWSVWAYLATALVSWLSYRRITLAAKVLGVALVAEISIILLLDLKIVYDQGLHSFDLTDFAPRRVLAPGLGITAIYAFNSMIGVEGTAIYQEEARDRMTTIPRATYLALGLVGLFYVFTAWCLTTSAGPDKVAALARTNPGAFLSDRSLAHLGAPGALAVGVLVMTSTFAAVLGLFNNSARYLYALARDGVLPAALAKTHPRHQSPHVAGLVLSAALVLVIAGAVVMRLDPLVNLATALAGVGSVGLMALLGITALAIPVFFVRKQIVRVPNVVAPALGGLVILAATTLAFLNYSALTGVDSAIINHLPYALFLMFLLGVTQALWLRARHYDAFVRIGSTRVDETS